MTYTPTGPLVFPGVYQLEQGASITDDQWIRFIDAVKEAFWLLPAQLRPYKQLGFDMACEYVRSP